MKELTKKILESGLIDRTIVQCLERWHLLTPEEAAIVQKPIQVTEALEKFVENLEELLDREPLDIDTDKPLREARFELLVTGPASYFCPKTGLFVAVKDQLGRLIVSPDYEFIAGDKIWISNLALLNPPNLTVVEVEKIYQGESVAAFQLTVR